MFLFWGFIRNYKYWSEMKFFLEILEKDNSDGRELVVVIKGSFLVGE